MCASAFTTMLWRRRIRVIGYAVVLIMFLYRGEASDYCLLSATLLGHVLGYLMASDGRGDSYRNGAIYEMRRLVGVVAGVTPVTNPTSTAIFKSLIALKTRCPIIFGFHPGAQKCSVEAAKIVRDAAIEAGAPENCIQWIEHPSIRSHRRPDEA